MTTYKRPTEYFDAELAEMLAKKIKLVDSGFNQHSFVETIALNCPDRTLTQRVELIADQLYGHLPDDYKESTEILTKILGPENHEETGMFKQFYWIMPIAKFVKKNGLDYFTTSINAIEEITKRNTGGYAIRPFIRQYPDQTLRQMKEWAMSDNFHLWRLASEGLRPKLPWATKLELFIDNPSPVFNILQILKEDHIHFVKKSVANHLTDYLKVNPVAAKKLIAEWRTSNNAHTQWIIKHATRKQ